MLVVGLGDSRGATGLAVDDRRHSGMVGLARILFLTVVFDHNSLMLVVALVETLEGAVILEEGFGLVRNLGCLLYTSPSPRDLSTSRMPSSA